MSYGCLPYSNLTTTNSKSRKVERGGVTTTENRMLVADGGTRGLGVRSQHRIAMLVAKAQQFTAAPLFLDTRTTNGLCRYSCVTWLFRKDSMKPPPSLISTSQTRAFKGSRTQLSCHKPDPSEVWEMKTLAGFVLKNKEEGVLGTTSVKYFDFYVSSVFYCLACRGHLWVRCQIPVPLPTDFLQSDISKVFFSSKRMEYSLPDKQKIQAFGMTG